MVLRGLDFLSPLSKVNGVTTGRFPVEEYRGHQKSEVPGPLRVTIPLSLDLFNTHHVY
jgi:hypothetical protein